MTRPVGMCRLTVPLAALLVLGLFGLSTALEETLCGDTICGTYGSEPSFDDDNRPPDAKTLGRAAWTALHTTAMYLPDGDLTDEQRKSFVDLVHSILNYPGDGGVLAAKILSEKTFVDEVKMAKTREECMLVVWKLHNIVSATIKPTAQMFPVSLGIKATQFDIVNQPSDKHFVLSTMNPNIRKQLIDALTTRWKAKGGELTNQHWTKRDMLNLPPDRTMLGRAFWTYLHTLSVYMDHDPQPEAVERYKAMFDVINNIYACPVCRGHFQKFYPDPVIQHEHKAIASKHDCIMFTWKIHNIVTADGINRDEWPDKTLYPKSKYHKLFNLTQFLIPAPHADEDQMRTKRCAKTSKTCLGKDDHYEIVADVEARWQIEGGIDQPLKDDSPPACDAPKPDAKILKMEMYIMGKCPWCGKAMEKIAPSIACDYKCSLNGVDYEGHLDFNIHMVGLNNGTWARPWLRAIHGPSELVGERLELCARQHYAKDYKYVKFMHCMDQNVSVIPIRAPECAEENGMDLDQLVACANMEGETMVATSYGYASWMGIDITPTFVINGKKKVLGLPKNFSDIVCEQLATTSTTLKGAAAVRLAEASTISGGPASLSLAAQMGGPAGAGAGKDLLVTGAAVGFISMLVVGGAMIVLRIRRSKTFLDTSDEHRSLIASTA